MNNLQPSNQDQAQQPNKPQKTVMAVLLVILLMIALALSAAVWWVKRGVVNPVRPVDSFYTNKADTQTTYDKHVLDTCMQRFSYKTEQDCRQDVDEVNKTFKELRHDFDGVELTPAEKNQKNPKPSKHTY